MPTVISIIFASIISMIGLMIDLSWFSFYIAILLSVDFFARIVGNNFMVLF